MPQSLAMHKLRERLFAVVNLPVVAAALVWRRLMFRTTFVAITGSVGKTTTKECVAAILSLVGPTISTDGTDNGRHGLPRTILRVRPWHRFAVLEIGITGRGTMWRSALLTRPDVVVVLGVGRNHSDKLASLDVTSREKAELVRGMRRGGVAVLNADDPRVAGMKTVAPGEVHTFGSSLGCETRYDGVEARWPERMSCRVNWDSERAVIHTRFVGAHWARAVVGAAAAARCCGGSLQQVVSALASVDPFPARLQPVRLPSGAIVLRDEHNGSVESFEPALDLLERARVRRRVLVTKETIDAPPDDCGGIRYLAPRIARAADLVVVVGAKAQRARAVLQDVGMPADRVRVFDSLPRAAEFFDQELKEGDLVLLKARRADHLSRLLFAMFGQVDCWALECFRSCLCEECDELGPVGLSPSWIEEAW